MIALVARVAALFASMWLVVYASSEGGWTKFAVGCFICTAGFVVIRRDLRAEEERRRA